ncbi:hypothetical protein DKX38_006119 [Salix brachista]|uniref:DNA polymerase zeta catalytic subunit N-terminal domain-containing protein n=1 Tax=Salix brachista TaxID=2182728 RepID=A0A5N5N1M5_9ROSI|nr:hypothetical protein DKX38_006119 [Salix brachista]
MNKPACGRVNEVLVIRVYGSTPAGQKTCLHVHRAFPYLYVPCSDIPINRNPEGDAYTHAISLALEKALKVICLMHEDPCLFPGKCAYSAMFLLEMLTGRRSMDKHRPNAGAAAKNASGQSEYKISDEVKEAGFGIDPDELASIVREHGVKGVGIATEGWPKGMYDGLGIILSVFLVVMVTAASEGGEDETPLQVKLNGVATLIGKIGLAFAVLTFLVLTVRATTLPVVGLAGLLAWFGPAVGC